MGQVVPMVLEIADPAGITLGVGEVVQHGREVDRARHDAIGQAVEQVEERQFAWDDLERHV